MTIIFSGTKAELDIELIAANYRRGTKNEPYPSSHEQYENLQSKTKSVSASIGTDYLGLV